MDEPEDVRRVSTIFVDDDWNNRKLKRVIDNLSNQDSPQARKFLKEWHDFQPPSLSIG